MSRRTAVLLIAFFILATTVLSVRLYRAEMRVIDLELKLYGRNLPAEIRKEHKRPHGQSLDVAPRPPRHSVPRARD